VSSAKDLNRMTDETDKSFVKGMYMNAEYGNANWDNIANWTPGMPGSTGVAQFGGGFASGNPFLNGSRTVQSLFFNTTSSFSITGGAGNALTLTAGSVTRAVAASGTQTIDVPVVLGAVSTWDINGTGQVQVRSSIGETGGARGFNKSGSGTLVLGNLDTAANTWSAPSSVNGGTLILNKQAGTTAIPTNLAITGAALVINQSEQIANTAAISFGGGSITFANNVTETIGGLSGVTGSISFGNGASLIVSQSGSTSFGGTINGGGSFAKQGAGTLVLGSGASDAAANTFTGATTISGTGALLLNKADGTNAVAGDINLNGGIVRLNRGNQIANTSNLSFAGGTLDLNGFGESVRHFSGSGAILLGTGSLTSSSTIDATFIGTMNSSAGGQFIKNGNATLTLGNGSLTHNVSSFAGTAVLNAGTVNLNEDAGVAPFSNGTMVVNGAYVRAVNSGQVGSSGPLIVNAGTFDLNGHSESIGALSGTGGTFLLRNATVTINQSNDGTFAGGIVGGGAGSVAKRGFGTLTLTGGASGLTNVDGFLGTLALHGGSYSAGQLNAQGPSGVVRVEDGAQVTVSSIGAVAAAGSPGTTIVSTLSASNPRSMALRLASVRSIRPAVTSSTSVAATCNMTRPSRKARLRPLVLPRACCCSTSAVEACAD